jgi:hypothetical protein
MSYPHFPKQSVGPGAPLVRVQFNRMSYIKVGCFS